MARPTKQNPERGDARSRLLEAARDLIRVKGFAATSVDDLCKAAGVTKGAFFHHFENKEALGVAAAVHWAETTSALFKDAPYHQHDDPLDRLLGYVEFRKSILEGDLAEFTCLVGTMTQEVYGSHPAIRDACAASIFGHAATLEPDIADAMTTREIKADWTPASLATHTQAVLQGAFILAKATGDRAVALECVDHLQRYITLLFSPSRPKEADMADAANDLMISRIIEAPRDKLWRCWVEPELLKQWFCPKPWYVSEARLDLRPGGEFFTLMNGPEGEQFGEPGVFLEVVEKERLVFTDAFRPGWQPSGRPFMTAEVLFEDAGAGKTRYTARAMHWTAEARKEHEEMGFHEGWGKAADQLETLAKTL